MNAQEKLENINKALESRKIVCVQAPYFNPQSTKPPMNWTQRRDGIFKIYKNKLWMAINKTYVCVDECEIWFKSKK